MEMNRSRTTTIEKHNQIKMTHSDIVRLLKNTGEIPESMEAHQVDVYFQVPGGGDWSNTSVDITSGDPIIVSWKEVERIVG